MKFGKQLARYRALLLFGTCFLVLIIAFPVAFFMVSTNWACYLTFTSAVASCHYLHLPRHAEIDVPLRIMALGDSITHGTLSSRGNGYRRPLQELLLGKDGKPGVDVDFIGSQRHGSMTDRDNEGHSGTFLSDIVGFVDLSIGAHPNLVLIHAGTNDMDKNRDVSTAIDRLEAIIRAVASGSPGVTILVAQIIFSTNQAMQTRTDKFNKQIASLVDSLAEENIKIMAVDMSDILAKSDMSDKKHPNDRGYRKMAQAWNSAIMNAHAFGMITAPPKPLSSSGFGLGLDNSVMDDSGGLESSSSEDNSGMDDSDGLESSASEDNSASVENPSHESCGESGWKSSAKVMKNVRENTSLTV